MKWIREVSWYLEKKSVLSEEGFGLIWFLRQEIT